MLFLVFDRWLIFVFIGKFLVWVCLMILYVNVKLFLKERWELFIIIEWKFCSLEEYKYY